MRPASSLENFVKGFQTPFSSFLFIQKQPRLYPFILLPLLINVLSFCLVIYFGFDFFWHKVMARIPQGEAWYWLILNYFLMLLAIIVVLVLVFFSFAAVGSLLAAPFNDLLSERVERLLCGGLDDAPAGVSRILRDAALVMLTETKKIALFLSGMLALFLLHFLPVAGTLLYPLLSVAWTACGLVMEYTGYVFARKRYGFADQRAIVSRHAALMSGFGLGQLCLLAIPFVQFLSIPLGVVSAVRLLHEAGELGGLPGPAQPDPSSHRFPPAIT